MQTAARMPMNRYQSSLDGGGTFRARCCSKTSDANMDPKPYRRPPRPLSVAIEAAHCITMPARKVDAGAARTT